MTFLEIQDADGADVVNFLRTPPNTYVISHFSYEICHYIESKIKLERDKKLNSIGI
jgi:hypothetical protein